MKKSYLVFTLTMLFCLTALPILSFAQVKKGSRLAPSTETIDSEIACKIVRCLSTSISGGLVKDECEGPLEVFFLQFPPTDKAKFYASLGYDYDTKTNSVVKRNRKLRSSTLSKQSSYSNKTGKFETRELEPEPIPLTPREKLLKACLECTDAQMESIINKYGETRHMPDLINQSDKACSAVLCLGGLAMGADGGSACVAPIMQYKSLLSFNKHGFDASATARKRLNWLNKCGQPGTGDTINKIQSAFGWRERF